MNERLAQILANSALAEHQHVVETRTLASELRQMADPVGVHFVRKLRGHYRQKAETAQVTEQQLAELEASVG